MDHVKTTLGQHFTVLVFILATAVILRGALLATATITFDADEAVVATMARHILAGEESPIFFYGQAYMGSLDAYLTALGFAVFGDSVPTLRLVQSLLYLVVIATTYALGWVLSRRRWVATVGALVVAVPPAVMTLYTTVTLGGYNEVLILGNLILILGYRLTHGDEESRWRWRLLGLLAGLGWWTNGLIIVYLLPVGLLLLRRFSWARLPDYLWAFVFFMVGSAPWWQYNFAHNNAAIEVFLAGRRSDNTGFEVAPVEQRLIGLVFLGIPSTLGMRYPWSGAFFGFPFSALLPVCLGVMLVLWLRRRVHLLPDARGLLLAQVGLFCVIFVASTFGTDPTGRYFLPLVAPLGILTAAALDIYRETHPRLAYGAAVALLSFFLIGNTAAVYDHAEGFSEPPGFTTQFDPISHIPEDHDPTLIDFLLENGLTRGYSTYWVAFRLAFLTREQIMLSSALPYKADLSYNPADDRYPPYREAARSAPADQVAYITSQHPLLDEIIRQRLDEAGVRFDETHIGPYTIFHGLSEHIKPEALGLDALDPEGPEA